MSHPLQLDRNSSFSAAVIPERKAQDTPSLAPREGKPHSLPRLEEPEDLAASRILQFACGMKILVINSCYGGLILISLKRAEVERLSAQSLFILKKSKVTS